MIWFWDGGDRRGRETRRNTWSLQGLPTRAALLSVTRPAIPGRPVGAPLERPLSGHATRVPVPPWKDPIMAAKPKPETTEDAREQARRALQTSMDTRQ